MQSWKAGSRGTQIVNTPMREDEKLSCIWIDDRSLSVFIGTNRSNLNQMNLRSQKTIEKYSDLGIGKINSLSSFDNLLFVGGNIFQFILINIIRRRALTFYPISSPIGSIHSSQFTIINRNSNLTVSLTICGCKCLFIRLRVLIVRSQ